VVAAGEGVEASVLRKDGGLDSSLGGCRELGHCCQGKNNTCRVQRHRNSISDDDNDGGGDDDEQNSVLVMARRNTCYCDSACLDLADCCRDYKQVCARKFTEDSHSVNASKNRRGSTMYWCYRHVIKMHHYML